MTDDAKCPSCNHAATVELEQGVFQGVCRSIWRGSDVIYRHPSCFVIEGLSDTIEMLEFEVRELRAGTADVDDVEAPSEVAA